MAEDTCENHGVSMERWVFSSFLVALLNHCKRQEAQPNPRPFNSSPDLVYREKRGIRPGIERPFDDIWLKSPNPARHTPTYGSADASRLPLAAPSTSRNNRSGENARGSQHSFRSARKGNNPQEAGYPNIASRLRYPKEVMQLGAEADQMVQLQLQSTLLRKSMQENYEDLVRYHAEIQEIDDKLVELHAQGNPLDPIVHLQLLDQAKRARNNLGPIRDDWIRSGAQLQGLEKLIVTLNETLQQRLRALGLHHVKDYSKTESDSTSSHISFISIDPKSGLLDNGPLLFASEAGVYDFSDVSDTRSVGSRDAGAEDASEIWGVTRMGASGDVQNEQALANIGEMRFSSRASSNTQAYGHTTATKGTTIETEPTPMHSTCGDAQQASVSRAKEELVSNQSTPNATKEQALLVEWSDTTTRINRWILHLLISSRIEQLTYLSCLPDDTNREEVAAQLRSVEFLKVWDTDPAAKVSRYLTNAFKYAESSTLSPNTQL